MFLESCLSFSLLPPSVALAASFRPVFVRLSDYAFLFRSFNLERLLSLLCICFGRTGDGVSASALPCASACGAGARATVPASPISDSRIHIRLTCNLMSCLVPNQICKIKWAEHPETREKELNKNYQSRFFVMSTHSFFLLPDDPRRYTTHERWRRTQII